MKKYDVQFMTPECNDGFIIVTANSEEHAMAIVASDNPEWTVLDASALDLDEPLKPIT